MRCNEVSDSFGSSFEACVKLGFNHAQTHLSARRTQAMDQHWIFVAADSNQSGIASALFVSRYDDDISGVYAEQRTRPEKDAGHDWLGGRRQA